MNLAKIICDLNAEHREGVSILENNKTLKRATIKGLKGS